MEENQNFQDGAAMLQTPGKPAYAGQLMCVVPNGKTERLNLFEGNSDYGYLLLKQTVRSIDEFGWGREKSRALTIKGTRDFLKGIAEDWRKNNWKVEGRIRIHEVVESEIPPRYMKLLEREDIDMEDALEQLRKRAGEEGEYLTKDGEHILQFKFYDSTGMQPDVFVQHDNVISGSSSSSEATFEEGDETTEEFDEPEPKPVTKPVTKTGKPARK
jgi:hypothetical protein